MFAPKGGGGGEGGGWEDKDEVARLLRRRYGPFVQDAEEMDRLLKLLADVGLFTMADVATRLRKSSLYSLSPPVPMAVLTLLHECYGQQVMRSPVYGDVAGKFTDEPLPVWTASKRLLADVFFFFEYLFEDGDGDHTSWPHLTRTNRTSFKHSSNPRLPEKDKRDYYGRIAIRDNNGIVRVEILKTAKMDKAVGGTKDEMIRKTSSHLTQSQAHFVKRNIFEEEIKELRKKYELGVLDSQGVMTLEGHDYRSPAGSSEDERERRESEAWEQEEERQDEAERNNLHSTRSRVLSRSRQRSLSANEAPPEHKASESESDKSDAEAEAEAEAEAKTDAEGGREDADEAQPSSSEKKRSKLKKAVRTLPTRRGSRIAGSLAGEHNYDARMHRRKTRSKSLDMVLRHISLHHHSSKQTAGSIEAIPEVDGRTSSLLAAVDHMLAHHDSHATISVNGHGCVTNGSRTSSSSLTTTTTTITTTATVATTTTTALTPAKLKKKQRKEKLLKSQQRAYSFSMIGVKETALPRQSELDDGELVVRFFGMKDNDHMLKIAANLSRAEMDVGPWEAANFKRGSSLLGIAKGFVPQNMYGGMKVHGGFWQMYKAINKGCWKQHRRDLVERIVERLGEAGMADSSKRIVFTGHSMGAALAAMAAFQLINRYPQLRERLFLIQFGAPRYARKTFARWLNEQLNGRIMQIHLEGDQTPKSPPSPPFFGWFAPGPVVEITSKHLYAKSGGRDEFGHEAHFQYWTVLRTILAYS